ncbi:MAG: low-complexity protein [Pseudomonadota bacterium]
MKGNKHTVTAAGTALLAALALTPAAATTGNPFSASPLPAGYMLADSMGSAAKTTGEAKCGADKARQAQEAKCGANKAQPVQEKKQLQEAKCGEAKCGANKKKL